MWIRQQKSLAIQHELCRLITMKKEKSVSINITITPERLAKLDAHAKENDRSRSATIGRLIDRGLGAK